MRFIIEPYIGAGGIDFLMHCTEVCAILAPESLYEEFYRTHQSKTASDHFKEVGLVVNYDENDLCDANSINLLN